MPKYISIVTESSNSSIGYRFDDIYNNYDFYLFGDTLSLTITEIEAQHYYNIIACILTLGEKYWHNFCSGGGDRTLDYLFVGFIEKNIKSVDRDIKIEKIIE